MTFVKQMIYWLEYMVFGKKFYLSNQLLLTI